MIDKQSVFNAVVAHSRAQPSKAMEFSACRYRTNDGKRCFIGALVPDELYDPGMECGSVQKKLTYDTEYAMLGSQNHKFFEVLTKMFGTLDSEELELLRDLQNVHDNYDVEFWEQQLERVSRLYKLAFPKQA